MVSLAVILELGFPPSVLAAVVIVVLASLLASIAQVPAVIIVIALASRWLYLRFIMFHPPFSTSKTVSPSDGWG